MAITQISRITHRKGLNENLPQLAGAELGWALDQRKLYIGNGKVADGAPTVGNTEILTEYSDILEIATSYTYKGSEAGYTVQTGIDTNNPTTRTLQQKFDDFASIKDFGATGDGSTDDTAAIQRALDQLFIQQSNPKVRRSLFFPAGTYIVSSTIKIPAYAKLWGEGARSSVIKYDTSGTVDTYAFRTSDSLGQVGSNITNNGATVPTDIQILNMGFETVEDQDVFLLESTTNSMFDGVMFKGPLTTASISASDSEACIRVLSTTLLPVKNVTLNNITTEGTGFGYHSKYDSNSVTISNSKISAHYKGVVLGDATLPSGHSGPTGTRIQQCLFDDIHSQGIEILSVSKNVSAFNIFYDVGNQFNGSGNATSTIIDIDTANNVCVGDMFERNDTDNADFQRIYLNEEQSIGFDGGYQIQLGTLAIDSGKTATLTDNTSSATTFATISLDNQHTTNNLANFNVNYSIKRDGIYRTGTMRVCGDGSSSLTYSEDYEENSASGIVLSATQSSNDVTLQYTTSSTGQDATISFSIQRLY